MELLEATKRLGHVLSRREEKEDEIQALTTMVRSICESMQSFTTGYSQVELTELFNSNSVFQEALDHVRRCEEILLNHETQNKVKAASIMDGGCGTSWSSTSGPLRRVAEHGRELLAESIEAFSGHVGSKIGSMMRLPPDALVRIQNASAALQHMVPFLHMAINASAIARAVSGPTTSDQASPSTRQHHLPDRISGLSQATLAPALSRSVTVPEHGRPSSGSRTLSLGNLSDTSCDHCALEPASKVARTERGPSEGNVAAAAANVPRWQLQIRSELACPEDGTLAPFCIGELRWDEASSPLQRLLGRAELVARVPKAWLHPVMPHHHVINYISRDHFVIEVRQAPGAPVNADILQAATLSLPHVDDTLGDTLSLPTGSDDTLDAATVGVIKPLSKLSGGTHILDVASQTWKWVRRGECCTIREGDRLALLLHPVPGSTLPDCLRDGIGVNEARCLLGIDFHAPVPVNS